MSRTHIKLDRPRWSTLFLFESHENMKRVCSRREHGSPPFYSRVNVYEFVNKQLDTAVLPLQFRSGKIRDKN